MAALQAPQVHLCEQATPASSSALFYGVVGVYALGLLPLFLLAHPVPDEQWFLREAAEIAAAPGSPGWLTWGFGVENRLGYGSVYWMVHAMVVRLAANPLRLLRLLGWLCLVSIPVQILRAPSRGGAPASWCACLLWLSFPAAWWTGKLTGPELPSLALAAAALARADPRRPPQMVTAWALFGAAAGIKATAACLLPFLWVLGLGGRWRHWAYRAAGLVSGFVLSNPILLRAPGIWFGHLRAAAAPRTAPWWPLDLTRLSSSRWTWDAVPSLGLEQWCMGAVGGLTWTIVCLLSARGRRALAASLATIGLTVAAIMRTPVVLGWYWFPMTLVFPFGLVIAAPTSRATRRLATGLVLLCMGLNVVPIVTRYRHRLE